MSYRVRPCYDGGRHRWQARSHFRTEPLTTPVRYAAPYMKWCERCGKWQTELQVFPPRKRRAA